MRKLTSILAVSIAAFLIDPALAQKKPLLPPVAPSVRPVSVATGTSDVVGKLADGKWMTPTNQIITPAGKQIDLPGMRPQAIVLSPDGKLLATAGKTAELVIIESYLPQKASAEDLEAAVAAALLETAFLTERRILFIGAKALRPQLSVTDGVVIAGRLPRWLGIALMETRAADEGDGAEGFLAV